MIIDHCESNGFDDVNDRTGTKFLPSGRRNSGRHYVARSHHCSKLSELSLIHLNIKVGHGIAEIDSALADQQRLILPTRTATVKRICQLFSSPAVSLNSIVLVDFPSFNYQARDILISASPEYSRTGNWFRPV